MSDISTTSWSEVDANNSQASPEGWPSVTMLPNQVEPSARMNMAGVKRFWTRSNPVYPTTQSTADSYVVTPTQAITGYGLYEKWKLRVNIANASTSPTMLISSLPPQPIKKMVASSVSVLAAGDIRAKAHQFYWDGTQFILDDPFVAAGNSLVSFAGPTAARTYTLPDASVSLGYLTVPSNTQVTSYTVVASDSGKMIIHPAADAIVRTFTLPAATFPVDSAVSFLNRTSQALNITAATSDTITLGGSTTTGTRSLAQNGMATAYRDTSTNWIITGTGLT